MSMFNSDFENWEQQAVDEIIAMEYRRQLTLKKIADREGLWMLASELHLNTSKIEQEIEELESELSDIERWFKGS